MIDFEKDDILSIARYLADQGFYYSPQWEQAADEIERLREALRDIASGRYSGILLPSVPPQDAAVNRARSALEGKE